MIFRDELMQKMTEILTKLNSIYCIQYDILHRYNEMDCKLNRIIKHGQTSKDLSENFFDKSVKNDRYSKPLLNLDKFTIQYVAPYRGFLQIEVDSCEIQFSDGSRIAIKNSLKKIFLDTNEHLYIINPINLKVVNFLKFEEEPYKKNYKKT